MMRKLLLLSTVFISIVFAVVGMPRYISLYMKQSELSNLREQTENLVFMESIQSHELSYDLTGYDSELLDSAKSELQRILLEYISGSTDFEDTKQEFKLSDIFDLEQGNGHKITVRKTRVVQISAYEFAGIVLWNNGTPVDLRSVVLFEFNSTDGITNLRVKELISQ